VTITAAAGQDGVLGSLVGLARTLRASGVAATPDRLHAMVAALATLDASRSADVYWAGRLTLCSCPEDLPRYDQAFAAWFGAAELPAVRVPTPGSLARQVVVPVPAEAAAEGGDPSGAATASEQEVLRHRDVARLTAAERAELHRMLAALSTPAPVRASRRRRPARHGPLDRRRTVRSTLERGGEPARLHRHAAGVRPRRLVLLVDVSGSMAAYADTLLRYAHACARSRPRTDVYTLGTRLTRVTREIAVRDADAAMAAVSDAVADWSGGTRLGADLKQFLDQYGQRGAARGAVVVIASDGWERGDATLLGEQMSRLARLAHRVVWVHPHRAVPGFEPRTAGMVAALPFVDDLVAGNTLAAFDELSRLLSARTSDRGTAGGAVKGRVHA
jgi:uncharacterized protein